ncbi:BN159_2729 family protein [Streptomyces anandii]|uniref:BN159_2729 family protein n=1 Tax=Streptomyces anandii TaxID=285454 RepID=UPI0037910266
MTTTPETRPGVEQDLTDRFGALARTFVAELEAQGRLVEAGGAAALEQLRARFDGSRPDSAYQSAVDVIVDDCGFPQPVATRVATALNRRGLLGPGGEPEPQHDPAPGPDPLTPPARGSIVLPRARREQPQPPETAPVLTVVPVPDQAPTIRPAAAQPRGEEPPAAWSQAQALAVTVAARLQTQHADRLEVLQIEAADERVTVVIRAASLADWEYWLDAIDAPLNVPTRRAGWAQVAAGRIDGVDVHLTAHEVPRLLEEAEQASAESFYLWGRVYDLTRPLVDQRGLVWLYLGQRQEGGMPLLFQRSTDGPLYPLGSIVMGNGPLTALPEPPAEPVAAAAAVQEAGGEQR